MSKNIVVVNAGPRKGWNIDENRYGIWSDPEVYAKNSELTKTAVIEVTVTDGPAPPDKLDNPLSVKGKTAKVKYSKLKKRSMNLAVTKVIRFVQNGAGSLTYTKASGNKKISINKNTGKVTVKKGLKKGTYKVTVKVKASGDENYAAALKKVTFTVRVN